MRTLTHLIGLAVLFVTTSLLLWSCGESPYVGMAEKSAQVDSLIIKARLAGKTNYDSLLTARRELAWKYIRSVEPDKVLEKDLFSAAKLFYFAGKLDTAVYMFEKVGGQDADNLIFNIYLQQERLEDAEALLHQRLAANVGDRLGDYYEGLYWRYLEVGDIDNARRIVDEALAVVPEDANFNFNIAKAELLFETGLKDDARALLMQLKTKNQDNARALRGITAKLTLFNLIDKPAPALKTQEWIDSEPLSMNDLRGKVVFLDFFGPWCGPCRAMFPHMKKLYEEYHQQGLVILGITRYYGFFNQLGQNLRDLKAADELEWIKKFKQHHDIPYPYAVAEMDDGRANEAAYGVYGIPHMALIDKKGMVRLYAIGSGKSSEEKLEQGVVQLLAE
ncbi:redoxin domain-containing protein [candidate division KSB1 bacterium]|nr:redoxin domain-containing protein [candidate division KSB1 bacterium]